jgi:hypothetical protein
MNYTATTTATTIVTCAIKMLDAGWYTSRPRHLFGPAEQTVGWVPGKCTSISPQTACSIVTPASSCALLCTVLLLRLEATLIVGLLSANLISIRVVGRRPGTYSVLTCCD